MLSRIARWLRPPRILRPTRAGWVFFVLTLGVGFAALNTGNNLLYLVLSLMLAFLVLSGVLSESALRGVHVTRRLPREFFEGRPTQVVLEIETFALRIGAGQTETRVYRFEADRRGPATFTTFRVSTRFPFGLFVKSLLVEAPKAALVYPGIHRASVPDPGGSDASSGDARTSRPGPGSEVGGLRDFETGDSARRIAWRATLRSGGLVVRDTERDRHGEVEVRLRTRGETEGDPFEQAVRHAASGVVAAFEAGVRVGLRTDEVRLQPGSGPRHRTRLLSYLARLRPGGAHVQSPGTP
jgi:uncharacterized protein (DUF58 family)